MYKAVIKRSTTLSFYLIVGLCAVIPFVTLGGSVGIGSVKGVVLYTLVLVASILWVLGRFFAGSLEFPRHRLFALLGGWVVVTSISAIASANRTISLWGRGFAMDSVATVLVLALFVFLVAMYAREQRKLVTLFLASLAGSVVAIVLQIVLYIARVAPDTTVVGSWVDFGYFVALTFVLALMMYEVLAPKGLFKVLSLSAMILSMLVLVVLNFNIAWSVVIVSSLLVFVYKSSVERAVEKSRSRFAIASFLSLVLGLFFLLTSASIGIRIARVAGMSMNDIRPSFAATTHVMRASLLHDPILGAGPGRFAQVWDLYRPIGVNQTVFWNTSFDAGYSTLETVITTNGVLGGLVVIVLMLYALIYGFRLFSHQFPDRFSRFIAVSSLIMFGAFVGLYVCFAPGLVLVVWGCMYLGLLLGVSILIGRIKVVEVGYLRDPRTSFLVILVLVLAMIGGCFAIYRSIHRFGAVVWYNRALRSADPATAARGLDRAIAHDPNDIYMRTRAALFAGQFGATAAAQDPDKVVLQTAFAQAESSARAAVAWDRTNAINWLALSQVYQLVAVDSTTDAYSAARDSAVAALDRNPTNAFVLHNLARLALVAKDTTTALGYLDRELAAKPDYLDAYILKAQIRSQAGERSALIQELAAYVARAPRDEKGYLLLAQAYGGTHDYRSALDAYNAARILNTQDPNPVLGIVNTYIALGDKDNANKALDAFVTLFPQVDGIDAKRTQIQAISQPSTTPSPKKK